MGACSPSKEKRTYQAQRNVQIGGMSANEQNTDNIPVQEHSMSIKPEVEMISSAKIESHHHKMRVPSHRTIHEKPRQASPHGSSKTQQDRGSQKQDLFVNTKLPTNQSISLSEAPFTPLSTMSNNGSFSYSFAPPTPASTFQGDASTDEMLLEKLAALRKFDKIVPDITKGALLDNVPLLTGIKTIYKEKLGALMVEQHFKENEYVFHHGDDADGFFIVTKGKFALVKNNFTIATFSPGDFFGEGALIHDSTRNGSVVAIDQTNSLLELHSEEFKKMVLAFNIQFADRRRFATMESQASAWHPPLSTKSGLLSHQLSFPPLSSSESSTTLPSMKKGHDNLPHSEGHQIQAGHNASVVSNNNEHGLAITTPASTCVITQEENFDSLSILSTERLRNKKQFDLLYNALVANPLLKRLSSATLKAIVSKMTRVVVEAGHVVIRQGDIGRHLYVIEHGELDIIIDNKPLNTISSGYVFGELALLNKTPRAATVISRTQCILWTVDCYTYRAINDKQNKREQEMIEKAILQVKPFQSLTSRERQQLCNSAELVDIPAGRIIFHQGADAKDGLFIVVSGQVETYRVEHPHGPPSHSYQQHPHAYRSQLSTPQSRSLSNTAHHRVAFDEVEEDQALMTPSDPAAIPSQWRSVNDSPSWGGQSPSPQSQHYHESVHGEHTHHTDAAWATPPGKHHPAHSPLSVRSSRSGAGSVWDKPLHHWSGDELQIYGTHLSTYNPVEIFGEFSLLTSVFANAQNPTIAPSTPKTVPETAPQLFVKGTTPPPAIAGSSSIHSPRMRPSGSAGSIPTGLFAPSAAPSPGRGRVQATPSSNAWPSSPDTTSGPQVAQGDPKILQSLYEHQLQHQELSEHSILQGQKQLEQMVSSLNIDEQSKLGMNGQPKDRINQDFGSRYASAVATKPSVLLRIRALDVLLILHPIKDVLIKKYTVPTSDLVCTAHPLQYVTGNNSGGAHEGKDMSAPPLANSRSSTAQLAAQVERESVKHQSGRRASLASQNINWNNLRVIGILGKGGFGTVHLIKDIVTNQSFALKSIAKKKIHDSKQEAHIINEKSIMIELNHHPFIVNIYATARTPNYLHFLTEACLGGDLFTALKRKRMFSEHATVFYIGCILLGLSYMHSKDIVYRDLKPENVVLDSKTGYAKIIDLGFAKHIPEGRTNSICFTLDYLSPEMLLRQPYGKSVDIWAVGVLIYELLAGFPPFYNTDTHVVYDNILHRQVLYPSYFSPEAKALLSGLLEKSPSKRLGCSSTIGIYEVMNHPWFHENIDWTLLKQQRLVAPIKPPSKVVLRKPNKGLLTSGANLQNNTADNRFILDSIQQSDQYDRFDVEFGQLLLTDFPDAF